MELSQTVIKISWNIKLEKNIFIFLLYIFVKA